MSKIASCSICYGVEVTNFLVFSSKEGKEIPVRSMVMYKQSGLICQELTKASN